MLQQHEVNCGLHQVLNALHFLHARRVAHRDLKPENILVASRTPLLLKLADFGLANDKTHLETFCGTQVYIAPEICQRGVYTTAVDLWSLGVIILECVWGLPSINPQKPHERLYRGGLAWCSSIVRHANDVDSVPLMELLTAGMLRLNPDERLSAEACLVAGLKSGLFVVRTGGEGHATGNGTPRSNPTAKRGTDGSAAMRTPALSSFRVTGGAILDQGEQYGTGRSERPWPVREGGNTRLRSPAVGSINGSSGGRIQHRVGRIRLS